MMFQGFWEYILSPIFLITTGILLVPFLLLLYSVYVTWEDNEDVMKR